MYENCDCNENDDKDDNFNRETCEWDCFANSKSSSPFLRLGPLGRLAKH